MDDPAAVSRTPALADARWVNEPIDVTGLPQLQAQTFAPLDPAYQRVKLIGSAVGVGIVTIGTAVAAVALARLDESMAGPLVIGGAVLLLVILAGVVQQMEVRRAGYLVRENDLSVRRGLLRVSITTAPFARIQDVSIDSGPIDRLFGLGSVRARTAGGGVVIPGLASATADRLKLLIADRAGVLAEAETDGELEQADLPDR